jgi:hypothetical protein
MFSQINFQGSGTITSDASVQNPITVLASFELLGNAWAAITSSDNTTTIFWDSVPDTNALPLAPPLSITNIQSSGCSPQCSSGGTCNPSSPVCICLSGFSGAQCQSCAEGHFGPSCQPCPSSCKTTCDQGTSGTGVCLNTTLSAASKCKCENAECDSTGACNCLPGWGTSQNGTECGQCAQGFFLTSAGGCQSTI